MLSNDNRTEDEAIEIIYLKIMVLTITEYIFPIQG